MVSLRLINIHSPVSMLSKFVIIWLLAVVLFPIDAQAQDNLGTLFYHAQNGPRAIQDNGGYEGRTIWEINLTGAPSDAVIKAVDIEYWITHTWVGDLRVWLTTENRGEWVDYVLWNREGGSTREIHEKKTGLITWNDLPVNRKWYLCAADYVTRDEGGIDSWKIWVYFDNAPAAPQPIPYYENFTEGKPGRSDGWEFYSNNEGRIEVVDGELRMDDRQDAALYSLNEAILHVDLSERSGVLLSFKHVSSKDENTSMPSRFTGHLNGDGVAVSNDGINWYRVTDLTASFQNQSFDLDAVVQAAGISYTSDFRIKFQQYDNYEWPTDGRSFDNISITATGADPQLRKPFGRWKGTFNSTAYGVTGTINDWIMREDYTAEGKWELTVVPGTGIKINPSGTYSFNPVNDRLSFLYVGTASILNDGQVMQVPGTLDVKGTVFRDSAAGTYSLKLSPQNLPPVIDTGTWRVNKTANIALHVFGIEISTGWNFNDSEVWNDSTYDFSLGLETDNTVSHVEFKTPQSYTFQIPSDSHTQVGDVETWHYTPETTSSGTTSSVTTTSGLTAHWTMDDNAANTIVTDVSGKGNNGTAPRNTASMSTTGTINGALNFNGTSDYITVPDRDEWAFSGDFTIGLWVKFNSLSSNWNFLIAQDEGPGIRNKWILSYLSRDQKTVFHVNGPTGPYPYGGYILGGNTWVAQTGVWYFIALARKGNTYTFYRQGSPDGSVVNTIQIPNVAAPLTIGWAEGREILNGSLDDVRIFNGALSETEISALYVGQQPPQPPPVPSARDRWDYRGRFTNLDELDKYGDGTYTIKVSYKGGTQDQTTVQFRIPGTTNSIPQPTKKPVLTSPKHNSITTSPVVFRWEPCNDANATSVSLRLERQDTGEYVDIRPPVDSTSSDPIQLSEGMWQAQIFCERWYDTNNPDNIDISVGKYSESDYKFEIGSGGGGGLGLIAHWTMDDNAANTTVTDVSGKGNNGTAPRNTASMSTTGKINGALNFNGTSDYITVPDRDGWAFSGDFTIGLWAKFNSFSSNWNFLIAQDEGPGLRNKWILSYLSRDQKTVFHVNGPPGPYPFGGYILGGNTWVAQTGVWYFIAMTRKGNTYTFYRQGSSDGSVVNTIQIPNVAAPLTIGWAEGREILNGSLDDVRIFNGALSEAEISALYSK